MGRPIRVIVVASSPLLHEALVHVLREDHTLRISSEKVQCDSLTTRADSSSDVVLIHVTEPLQPSAWRDIALLTLQTKVIVLLRHGNPELVKRARQFGVVGIVTEDADRNVIFKAIHEVASGGVWNDSPPGDPSDRSGVLLPSRRENEVLGLIRRGLSNREIADQLCISERTVKSHINRLLHKFQVKNRVQLALCTEDALQGVRQG